MAKTTQNDVNIETNYFNGLRQIKEEAFDEAIDYFTNALVMCSSKGCGDCNNCTKNASECGKIYYHRGFAYLRRKKTGDPEKAYDDFCEAKNKFKIAKDYYWEAETNINLYISSNLKPKSEEENPIKFVQDGIEILNRTTNEKNSKYYYTLGRLYYEKGKISEKKYKEHNQKMLEEMEKAFFEAEKCFNKITDNSEYRSYIIRTYANIILTLKEKNNVDRNLIENIFKKLEIENDKYNEYKDEIEEVFDWNKIYIVSTFSKLYNSFWYMQAINAYLIIKVKEHLTEYINMQIKDLILKAEKPQTKTGKNLFYKFYSLDTPNFVFLKKSIENSTIFFATADKFNKNNDTQDITALSNAISTNLSYAEVFREFIKKMNPKAFCATGTYKNYALWLHYANNFKGICIEYEFNENSNLYRENKDLEIGIEDSFYDTYLFHPILYRTLDEFESLKERGARYFVTDVLKNILFAKHEHFSYEDEYRFIKLCGLHHPEEECLNINLSNTNNYVDSINGKISRIYIGNRDFIFDSEKGLTESTENERNENDKKKIKEQIDEIISIAKEKNIGVSILFDRATFEFKNLDNILGIKSS